jgi:FkbM family methyltransferase
MQAQVARLRLSVQKRSRAVSLAADVRSATRIVKLMIAADVRSATRIVKLMSNTSGQGAATARTTAPVAISLRPLNGERVVLRPHTADYAVLVDTFVWQYHVEPVKRTPATIFDLGANIGLTMAHYAVLYPEAKVFGVELDADNFAILEQNIAPYRSRVTALCGAVWTEDGEVDYGRSQGHEWGFAVGKADDAEQVTAPAFSMNTLFELSGWATVDFVKMDIEGAERDVLREGAEWAPRVDSIGVEVHWPYTVEECGRDLQALGFETGRLASHGAGVWGDRTARGAR